MHLKVLKDRFPAKSRLTKNIKIECFKGGILKLILDLTFFKLTSSTAYLRIKICLNVQTKRNVDQLSSKLQLSRATNAWELVF